jgi:hypothetical protein
VDEQGFKSSPSKMHYSEPESRPTLLCKIEKVQLASVKDITWILPYTALEKVKEKQCQQWS